MNDKKVLKELKKGNVVYYELLIDTYSSYVSVIVQKVGRKLSSQDIEELIADVFIKIWNMRHELAIKDGCLKSYLATMARNITLNKLKSVGKLNEISFEEEEVIYEALGENPEEQLLVLETQETIASLVEKLKEPDREIFIRRYFYFESLNDISQKMGISVGTIGSKIARSKKKLEKNLIKEGLWVQ